MRSETKPFSVDLKQLRNKPKNTSPAAIQTVDQAGERQGFVAREAISRRGRPASPRTGQVHAKVLPRIASEISAEAIRRGVTQGILIEEAWTLYLTQKSGK